MRNGDATQVQVLDFGKDGKRRKESLLQRLPGLSSKSRISPRMLIFTNESVTTSQE
jgi:hypothetical protein